MSQAPHIEIRAIPVEETYPVRRVVLWPNDAPEVLRRPGDDLPDTVHIGGFLDGQLVSVASVMHDSPPDTQNPAAWRLRGVATLQTVQGQGMGGKVLRRCIAYVAQQNGNLLWCNSRLNAIGFYERLGFQKRGDLMEGTGGRLTCFMWREIRPEDAAT